MRVCRHCDEEVTLKDGVWVLVAGTNETPEVCTDHRTELVMQYGTFYTGLDNEAVHEPY